MSPQQDDATRKVATKPRRKTKPRKPIRLTVTSDLDEPTALLPWERELLVPVVDRLLQDLIVGSETTEDDDAQE
ncbi:MAG: hypothetical protein H6707_18525 [Deltaproteobacteria bacterium]|nr:hypothetical protein [Deltaproteobacteria bacterium]